MSARTRSPSFVPQLLIALKHKGSFHCKFSELPKSYQAQPYNLASKVQERGGYAVRVFFNTDRDVFSMIVTKSIECPVPTT